MAIPRLMLVTDRLRSIHPIVDVVKMAVAGGVDSVQIREKDLCGDELSALATEVRDVVSSNATLLINGSSTIASKLGIGLHLPEGSPFSESDRSCLRAGALVGRSVHSVQAARESNNVDYLIAGHVFETGSKAGLPVLGVSGLAEIVDAALIPVLAIGGITPNRVRTVLDAGAVGFAIMSGICSCDDPRGAARDYLMAMNGEYMSSSNITDPEAIDVQVNGKSTKLDPGMTISEFLGKKGTASQHGRSRTQRPNSQEG